MAANPISRDSAAWSGPFSDIEAVTPHDTNEITPSRGLVANGAGNVVVRPTSGDADVTLAVLAGVVYSFSVKAVRSTGTTATGIHALY